MNVRCHHNCFECELPDCQNDVLTKTERMEQNQRDINYSSFGSIMHQRPTRKKHRGRR